MFTRGTKKNKFELSKERISQLEDRLVEIIQSQEQEQKNEEEINSSSERLYSQGYNHIYEHMQNDYLRRRDEIKGPKEYLKK